MLTGYCRDPKVVIRDRPTHLCKVGLELSVTLGRALIRKQNDSRGKEVADVCKLFLTPLCSMCSKVKFAEHDPRHVHGLEFRKPRRQGLIAAEVSNHDVSVHQDTTNRVH